MSVNRFPTDERTYLIRGQLVLITLIRLKSADLHGKNAITGADDTRKIPVSKLDVVFSMEIVVNRGVHDIDRTIGLLLLPIKEGILGVATNTPVLRVLLPSELLDGVDLVIYPRVSADL